MYNIFQGNKLLEDEVINALELDIDTTTDYRMYNITPDIYFQTFFYLTQRFGPSFKLDDYKDAGVWCFKVKQFTIEVRMNSSWVIFMVFGRKWSLALSPCQVKYNRVRRDKRDYLINLHTDKRTDKEVEILNNLWPVFAQINGITDETTKEEFVQKYQYKWFEYIEAHNESVMDIDLNAFTEKYGELRKGSYERHALRALHQFLKNMLTPVYVRDVAYNIKGRISDAEACKYGRYVNNVKIEFIKPQ